MRCPGELSHVNRPNIIDWRFIGVFFAAFNADATGATASTLGIAQCFGSGPS